MAIRLILLPWLSIPEPVVHDEFSYLLGAETFAAGRLANPPHPMWIHFETFHVNQQPTYASKYPPAQSLFLALGEKLFGNYWFGVWLSVGFMCACLTWMLQGWLARRYALLGGLVAVAQWGIGSYWMNSYWGGALGAAGGALVLGALPRLARRISLLPMLFGSAGVLLLVNTRPYEGALTILGAATALLIWRRRAGRPLTGPFAAKAAIPAALVLLAGAAGTGYYNYRVTGSALVMPWVVNQQRYSAAPHFWILPATDVPNYNHESLRRLWVGWDRELYFTARAHPGTMVVRFFLFVLPFYISPIAVPLIAIALFVRRGRKVWLAVALASIPAFGILLEKSSWYHYFSPAAGLMLVLTMGGLQYLRAVRIRGVRAGNMALVVFIGVFLTYAAVGLAEQIRHPQMSTFAENRRMVIDKLEREGGRHLVIVRYSPQHNVHEEWVYNHADIDSSAIVWAQDMGSSRNRELLDYYRDRRAWLLDPDPEPSIQPYTSGQ